MFEVGRGALSRTTRNDGAPIEVCPRCGARESLYGYDAAKQVPFTEWPLLVEQLVEEERALLTFEQGSDMSIATITPNDAKRMLDDDEDGPDGA